MEPEETVLYSADDVRVTNSRAIFRNSTFFVDNIMSVAVKDIPSGSWAGALILMFGAMLSLFMIAQTIKRAVELSAGIGMFVIGAMIAIFGFYANKAVKKKFGVKIGSSSGERMPYVSEDSRKVQDIVHAINQAKIARGQFIPRHNPPSGNDLTQSNP